MKKIIYASLGLFLLQVSCTPNAAAPTVQPTIYKKWFNKETVVNGITEIYNGNEACGKDYIEFFDTNKIKTIDIDGCEEDELMTGTFVINANNITITEATDLKIFEIFELTDTVFSLKIIEDYDDDGDVDTIIERYTGN